MQERILFLGPADSLLITWLKDQGETVIQTMNHLSVKFITKIKSSLLISYGYRYIIKKDILDLFPNKAINLHISYLPWNRGADPNLWSFIDDTPKGVTIHYLDDGIDTGDIIIQKRMEPNFFSNQETLKTSYEKLQTVIQNIFKQNWIDIKNGNCQRIKQAGTGTVHKTKDKDYLPTHLLTDGWNTKISVLEEYAAEIQMSKQFWGKYDSEIEEMRNKIRST